MSLSQKHPGLVFVPWFNLEEWTTVYHLIYSQFSTNWVKALEVMKIWKLRTPVLSAGVEGTSILLETLIIITADLKSYEIKHIYSTALVRFLNLCAANNDKQGTFYKTAMKNELPKWLINLRHEIAHGHKVPPTSLLELSVRFCLNWLKTKYWDVQSVYMENKNFYYGDNVHNAVVLFSCLMSGWLPNPHDPLFLKFKSFYGSVDGVPKEVYEVLRNVKNIITKTNPEYVCEHLAQTLLKDELMLKSVIDNSGTDRRISEYATRQWSAFFNYLQKIDILTTFNEALLNYLGDETHSSSKKEIVSLWLKEFFLAANQDPNRRITLQSNIKSVINTSFKNTVLKRPTKYTSNFLKELLLYEGASVQLIQEITELVSGLTAPRKIMSSSENVFTVEYLGLCKEDVKTMPSLNTKMVKWRKVLDPLSHGNFALGVLPNQCTHKNPTFIDLCN